ncbi:retropepsin-like aspartic protease family protein [Sphingosinicella rhizophila]|uniref:TIGR02281 family clan AA aspartic protease n=1 Tax=Sphingosinicella rhizophila TaxID=3050082 RepID=A0ABU3Q8J8_9SPHN|nr:TIGR02281 family clan AA aspartic protease [Sphingosinicella sp. GR2756]MDT9599260.1 TIGR02281 family clan AA aspartic protease [Sphingosinicella sp. GR2756]
MNPAFDTQSPYFIPMIVGGLILLVVLLRLPFIGALIRTLFSIALIAILGLLLVQRAPFDPYLARIAERLQLDRQEVVGSELRIPMSSNGHFMANVTINGVKRRMLIDSGATVTAFSPDTAAAAGLEPEAGLLPVIIQTANGASQAQTTTIDELKLGNIVARDLKAIVSPGLRNMDLLGMNFLSKLKSWRVEENVLVLVPNHPQPVAE